MASEGGAQELFFEAVYADPEISDADKARWLHGCAKAYWRRIAAAEAERDALQERIEEWETSTMLVNGHGDADGITPEQNERNIGLLTEERDAAIAALRAVVDAPCDPEDIAQAALDALCGPRAEEDTT